MIRLVALLQFLLNGRHFSITNLRGRAAVVQRLRFLLGHMLDVLRDLDQAFFAHHALERRHDGLEAGHDLGIGTQNGFTDVIVVGYNHAVVGQPDRAPVQSLQVGAARAGVRAMTGDAAEFLKQLFPL